MNRGGQCADRRLDADSSALLEVPPARKRVRGNIRSPDPVRSVIQLWFI